MAKGKGLINKLFKGKTVTTESVESEKPLPPIEDGNENEEREFVPDEVEEAAVKSVAKKKGLSSFGAMLKAQSVKRKERNLKFKNDGEKES
jgi:hypothetical protein